MEELARLEEERGNLLILAITATFISTLTAVVYCKVNDRRRRV